MNDEWIKVDDLMEVDDLAERIQEIEQEKEMWKSILDSYNLQYKFEIGEHEEKKVDQFCIGKVYTLELWVTESYYQMAKEIVDEVKNAPSADDAWELQNEVPIEEEEYKEIESTVDMKEETAIKNNKNDDKILLAVFIILFAMPIFLLLITEVSKEIKNTGALFTMILLIVAMIITIVGVIVMLTKKKKEE